MQVFSGKILIEFLNVKVTMTAWPQWSKPSAAVVVASVSVIIIPLRGGGTVLKLAGAEVTWRIFTVQPWRVAGCQRDNGLFSFVYFLKYRYVTGASPKQRWLIIFSEIQQIDGINCFFLHSSFQSHSFICILKQCFHLAKKTKASHFYA